MEILKLMDQLDFPHHSAFSRREFSSLKFFDILRYFCKSSNKDVIVFILLSFYITYPANRMM